MTSADVITQLVSLRKERGLTQKELSEACGLTQSVIARIESAKSSPTAETLTKIATAMNACIVIQKQD